MSNKKNVWLLRMLKIGALLLPVVLFILFYPVSDFDDTTRVRNFYLEEKDSLDVIVMGSSENYAGYSPVLAYEEYGFTSYPYVFSANEFALFEEQLNEILRMQSPKLIVVDVAEILNPKAPESSDVVLRQLTASIPFSKQKIEMIQKYGDPEEQLSYYLPFFVNHGKATPQTALGYMKTNYHVQKRGYSLLKGTLTFTGSGENWDGPYVTPINTAGDDSKAELKPGVAELCQQVLETCDKHPEIKFLFINTPHRITTEERYQTYQCTNTLGEMIESYGYDFVNLESMTDKIGIVPETDFYNNHHMNLYGQYKVTRFLCDILTKEYGIQESQLTPENREKWDTCVEYRHLYYQLFDEEFKSRPPEEFGLWLQEDAWLISTLDEMKKVS